VFFGAPGWPRVSTRGIAIIWSWLLIIIIDDLEFELLRWGFNK